MKCPTCSHEMNDFGSVRDSTYPDGAGRSINWCPKCGTINTGATIIPALVTSAREMLAAETDGRLIDLSDASQKIRDATSLD